MLEKRLISLSPESFEFIPSGKPSKSVGSEIDKHMDEIRDKIKLADEVKQHPPEKDVMKEVIGEGVYAVDLNCLLMAQLSDCPATVIPMLIDHAVRTNIDIKEAYKAKKRLPSFNFVWLIILLFGLIAGLLFMSWIFKIF